VIAVESRLFFRSGIPVLAMSNQSRPNTNVWSLSAPNVRFLIAALIPGFVTFLATPARAEFSICNKSLDVLNVAIAYDEDGVFKTEGWWSVGANRCAEVIRQELLNRYIYVYAEDVFGQAATTGDQSMCIDNKKFVIKGNTDCPGRGFVSAFFFEVDTLSQDRWTLVLKGDSTK
jgi:uncharacterized membrane protein